jgi:hypothetical protein
MEQRPLEPCCHPSSSQQLWIQQGDRLQLHGRVVHQGCKSYAVSFGTVLISACIRRISRQITGTVTDHFRKWLAGGAISLQEMLDSCHHVQPPATSIPAGNVGFYTTHASEQGKIRHRGVAGSISSCYSIICIFKWLRQFIVKFYAHFHRITARWLPFWRFWVNNRSLTEDNCFGFFLMGSSV